MRCPVCGSKLKPNNPECPQCGTKIHNRPDIVGDPPNIPPPGSPPDAPNRDVGDPIYVDQNSNPDASGGNQKLRDKKKESRKKKNKNNRFTLR